MAERPTKAAGRRTTPQLTADNASSNAPRRTVRATRSQSRDISDNESGREATRVKRSAKQASSVRSNDTATKKGRPTKALTDPDLSVVAEEAPHVQYPQLPDVEEGQGRDEGGQTAHAQTSSFSKSPGGASAFSGTTARTSRTAQDLDDLTSESLQDALPDLCATSEKLLDFLLPPRLMDTGVTDTFINTFRTELGDKRSRTRNNFKRLMAGFDIQRAEFTTNAFVDVKRAVRALLMGSRELENAQGPWRPEPLLQKANLAALVAGVISPESIPDGETFWGELDHTFPNHFLYAQDDDMDADMLALTMELALEIRTQYAIVLLSQRFGRPDFNLDVILNQAFNEEGQTPRGWNFANINSRHLPKSINKALVQRLVGLRRAYEQARSRGTDRTHASEALANAYPWKTFSKLTLDWVIQQQKRLANIINPLGGRETIIENLIDQIQSRKRMNSTPPLDDDSHLNGSLVQLKATTQPSLPHVSAEESHGSRAISKRTTELRSEAFSSSSPKARQLADRLREREMKRKAVAVEQRPELDKPRTHAATASSIAMRSSPKKKAVGSAVISPTPPATTSGTRQHDVDDNWQPQNVERSDEDVEEGDSDVAFQTQKYPKKLTDRVRQISSQQQAESNKENEPRTLPSSARSRQGPSLIDAQPNARRIRFDSQDGDLDDQEEIEVSQDQGFQQSRHPSNVASRPRASGDKRRAHERELIPRSPLKRARFNDPLRPRESSRESEERPPASSKALQERPRSTQVQVYREVNAAAKNRVQTFSKKGHQSRQPWTDEEAGTLMDYIGQYSTKYARIKLADEENDFILIDRDQGALKDKARNIKMDLLKAGRYLPRNFEYVALSKALIEKLAGLGVDYDPTTGHRTDGVFADAQEDE